MKPMMKTLLAAALVVSAPNMVTPAAAGGLNDETIYAIFDQANMADIATGRLGWKKGQSAEVRMLAKMVITDHGAVQHMGRELAKELGVLGTPPDDDGSWAAQAEALARLSKLSGSNFDEAYLRHEIAYHTAVIDAINTTLMPSIKNQKLKDLVNKVLPGFKHHLAETKAAADKLGVNY